MRETCRGLGGALQLLAPASQKAMYGCGSDDRFFRERERRRIEDERPGLRAAQPAVERDRRGALSGGPPAVTNVLISTWGTIHAAMKSAAARDEPGHEEPEGLDLRPDQPLLRVVARAFKGLPSLGGVCHANTDACTAPDARISAGRQQLLELGAELGRGRVMLAGERSITPRRRPPGPT